MARVLSRRVPHLIPAVPTSMGVRLAMAAMVALPPLGIVACGGSETGAVAAPARPSGTRSEKIEHEACDVTGSHVEALDTNGDGKPDIRRVYDGSKHEQCRVVDLNHDGKPDLYEYFDSNGSIRRREFCYDDTGAVNAIEIYQGGKLKERAYDTTGQHRIDTWDWFDPNAPIDAKTGRPAHPVRRERDVRGDGTIDQWWVWTGDKVSIGTDRNGDGKPDPESAIVLGGGNDEAGAPPQASPASGGLPAANAGVPSSASTLDGGQG
jgi:hypothetical protein